MIMEDQNLAIAHWGEHCNGGGERVGWELARTFDKPLYVGTSDVDIGPGDVEVTELWSDNWARWAIGRGGLTRMAAYRLLWEKDVGPLAEADTLVTSGNEPLFYVPDGQQTWIAYVHHTGRNQTDLLSKRWGTGVRDRIGQSIMSVNRWNMAHQASKPDLIVANSEPVKQRINRYWGVPKEDIIIVYPPVPVEEFSRKTAETEDFYLSLSRLDWHKQIDETIRAFNGTDKRLIVAGDGSERDNLEAIADENIEFVGYVSEERKRELLSSAQAVVNNAFAEDFGITTVEPLASGTPVIGVKEGMTQFLCVNGKAGITYKRGVKNLSEAIDKFDREGVEWSEKEIEAFATRFSVEKFHRGMRDAVDLAEKMSRRAYEPSWHRKLLNNECESTNENTEVAFAGGDPNE